MLPCLFLSSSGILFSTGFAAKAKFTRRVRNTIEIKPYNIKELCAIYGVSYRTMVLWIEAHKEAGGEKVGRYYTALQVEIIFEKLGLPSQVDEDDG